jgi:hypothetical protein
MVVGAAIQRLEERENIGFHVNFSGNNKNVQRRDRYSSKSCIVLREDDAHEKPPRSGQLLDAFAGRKYPAHN